MTSRRSSSTKALASRGPNAYDAFLSYAHRDNAVATAIRKGLQQVGRRVGQLRALRVADTGEAADPQSWAKATSAMDDSRFMVAVLSPESAVSQRVDEEVRYWLRLRGLDGLMLVLAGGRLVWDSARDGFDPERSTAAPPALSEPGSLPAEPLFIDVSGDAPWELSSLVFRDKVTSLAAPIHGKPKDELSGDDVRERLRFRRVRRAAIAALAVLTVLAVMAASVAIVQRGRAIRQARDALAAELDTTAAAIFSRTLADSSVRALAETLAAQRIRSNPADSAGPFYTATVALNAVHTILPTPVSERSLARTADGHTMATGGSDGSIRLWDLADPARPQPLGKLPEAHTGAVTSMSFGPDGRRLASAGRDGAIRLWNLSDPARPEPLGQPLNGHSASANSVAFSPDGRVLAATSPDFSISLWNVADPVRPTPLGKLLRQRAREVPTGLAFAPDGRLLAAAVADSDVNLWNVTDLAHPEPLHIGDGSTSVAVSPDGHFLASAGTEFAISLYRLDGPADPQFLTSIPTDHLRLNSIAFSPDGHILAGASAFGDIPMWYIGHPSDPLEFGRLRGHTAGATGVVFSSDGDSLFSTGFDGTVRSWNPRGAQPEFVNVGGKVLGLAFGPKARIVASAGLHNVTLWDLADPDKPRSLAPPLAGHTDEVRAIALSPDGRTLASASFDKTVRLWNTADPTHPSAAGGPLIGHTGVVTSVAFSPDGHTLASGSHDGSIRMWSVQDPGHPQPLGKPLVVGPHGNFVLTEAFSPDGRTLAVGGVDHVIRLWDVTDPSHPRSLGQPLEGHTSAVRRVAFSPDGRLLASGGDDNTIRLWSVADPVHSHSVGAPLRGHTRGIADIAFSPDGHSLASASYDQTARLWDLTDPAHPYMLGEPLRGHTQTVMAVAFSPDGHLLLSGGFDDTARLWPTPLDATVSTLCSKLASNISHQQWRDWISPDVGYLTLCPNLPVPQD